jgi:hypothetical protein
LEEHNELDLWVRNGDRVSHDRIPFAVRPSAVNETCFELDLGGVRHSEEIGQCIDGCWHVSTDENGQSCLEVRPEHAGYDRLFGIGRHDWTSGYRVQLDFRVTKWTKHDYFNVGILFKWNPHSQGDGTSLPTNWSTGLAYYASNCPGLRLRYGVDVHFDSAGNKYGEHLLQEKPISAWKSRAREYLKRFGRFVNRPLAQLSPGTLYTFDLLIHPKEYTLEIFEKGRREPLASLQVFDPPDLLPSGCVGLIACNCAVRIYGLKVSPAQLSHPEEMVKAIDLKDSSPVENHDESRGSSWSPGVLDDLLLDR